MIRHFLKYLFVVIGMGFIFLLAYIGFVTVFLGGEIPPFTSLWCGLSFIIGIFAGLKIEDC